MSRESLCLDGALHWYEGEIQKVGVPNHVSPQEKIVFFKDSVLRLRVHGRNI